MRFGGNDVGSIMIEENVVSAAGAHNRASEEELRRMIRDAGFIPKQRDTLVPDVFSELALTPVAGRDQTARIASHIPIDPAADSRHDGALEFRPFIFVEGR